MFAKLTGTIDSFIEHQAVVDVQGVGYLVACSSRTRAEMGTTGSPVRLYIETQVREDAINLYGFIDREEQSWFKLLTTVQGVGSKVALAILSACPLDQLGLAIAAQDKAVLTQADGVGPKLAARIVSELKDKVEQLALPVAMSAPLQKGRKPLTGGAPETALSDVVSALVNLGYGRAEAYAAVMKVRGLNDNAAASVSDMIKLSLKELGQG